MGMRIDESGDNNDADNIKVIAFWQNKVYDDQDVIVYRGIHNVNDDDNITAETQVTMAMVMTMITMQTVSTNMTMTMMMTMMVLLFRAHPGSISFAAAKTPLQGYKSGNFEGEKDEQKLENEFEIRNPRRKKDSRKSKNDSKTWRKRFFDSIHEVANTNQHDEHNWQTGKKVWTQKHKATCDILNENRYRVKNSILSLKKIETRKKIVDNWVKTLFWKKLSLPKRISRLLNPEKDQQKDTLVPEKQRTRVIGLKSKNLIQARNFGLREEAEGKTKGATSLWR